MAKLLKQIEIQNIALNVIKNNYSKFKWNEVLYIKRWNIMASHCDTMDGSVVNAAEMA